MNNDLTFFTNEEGATLLDRFKKTLKDVSLFDVIVGYFRTSGFFTLYQSFENIEKIRILIGLNIDSNAYELIQQSKKQQEIDFESHAKTKEIFNENVVNEMEISEDSKETELGVKKFIELLKNEKLEIKVYPIKKIHAKVYISRFSPEDRDFGRVITGSSNFSYSGLIGNLEFNVELKNRSDVEYALNKFESLWKDAVDVTSEYVDTVNKKTWLNDQITPYHLYLKFLYEYFKEDINIEDDFESYLPEGFMELKYQKQAVISAKKILDSYNGVFLSDVVGLGKTFISALLAQQLRGRILIICPPVLQDYWKETFFDFGVRRFKVESLGKLESIIKEGVDKFDYIFVDEAHRFRNEVTQGYELLHKICFGKKVILVSATPLNNNIDDIYSQIKLFQIPKKSTITGIKDLEVFFNKLQSDLNKYEKTDTQYPVVLKSVSKEIRDKLLKYVMVRRTRTEVRKFFSEDMQKQNLFFPELSDPRRIIYEFDAEVDSTFTETMELIKTFKYSRYTPLLYLIAEPTEFEKQSQRNIGGFMKSVLVKRLESSFYAFKRSLDRFIISYEKFIEMFHTGTVYISKKVNVYDFLDNDDEEKLLELVETGKVQSYKSSEFNNLFIGDLEKDLALLRDLKCLWVSVYKDPKIIKFISELLENKELKDSKPIIFTESKETGDYLYYKLNDVFKNKVMLFSSQGGVFQNSQQSVSIAKDLIKENFDPKSKQPRDDIKILITTDILAEGVNLHKSNIIINYDLPWNPTRVLQRVGRVNRVGTKHKKIFVFNFFPTTETEKHLNLEVSIKAKIQAFHDTLGEDSKYLSEEEKPDNHELFGDKIYRKLTSKKTFEAEEEEQSELEYLEVIRNVRDKNPELFEKIKRLPKKARSCHLINHLYLMQNKEAVITFFRKGQLKKFFISNQINSKEINFFEAASFFKCSEDEKKHTIPEYYYTLLNMNKREFDYTLSGEDFELMRARSGGSNSNYIIRRLKDKALKLFKGFTDNDDDDELIKRVLKAFQDGVIPDFTSKKIKKELEKEIDPLKVLKIIREHISPNLLNTDFNVKSDNSVIKEIILSEYLNSSPNPFSKTREGEKEV